MIELDLTPRVLPEPRSIGVEFVGCHFVKITPSTIPGLWEATCKDTHIIGDTLERVIAMAAEVIHRDEQATRGD